MSSPRTHLQFSLLEHTYLQHGTAQFLSCKHAHNSLWSQPFKKVPVSLDPLCFQQGGHGRAEQCGLTALRHRGMQTQHEVDSRPNKAV
eukprot:5333085-Pleurochrysis_carterae.AAC.2